MKVWAISHWVDDGSDHGTTVTYALFEREGDARASMEADDEITEFDLYDRPLQTETRWRVTEVYRPERTGLRKVGSAKRYQVNELGDEFGKGVLRSDYDFGSHLGFTAPTAKEARAALREAVAPDNKREQERLDYLARCTHQFRCPDHGDLVKAPPENHVGCSECGRWVDDQGRRFGRYLSLSRPSDDGWGIQFSMSFSAGVEGTDVDLGPLPADERAEAEAAITPLGPPAPRRSILDDVRERWS